MNESKYTCEEEFYGPKRDELYVVIPITVIYVVIFVTGTVGNVTTCVVISRNKSLHTATNYYLFSLAVSDLVLLVAGLPQEIYLIWNRYPYIFGNTFCFLRGLLAETSGNATVLTITGFTVERYLAICHPFLSHTMSKLSRAVKLILFIWMVAVSFAIPQALPLRVEGTCPHCLPTEPVMGHSFEISTFVFFLAPMTVITVLYILIGTALKASSVRKSCRNGPKAHSRSCKKVVKMLVAVVAAFFICWAPFHVQRLYTIYATFPKPGEDHALYLQIYSIVTYVSGVLYYVSATTNPILYSIMSVKFREAFKETFARCCGCSFRRGKPQRRYSVLSRSNAKVPESSDSAKDDSTNQTNTVLGFKAPDEPSQSDKPKRFKFTKRDDRPNVCAARPLSPPHTTFACLPVTATADGPFNGLAQYFECVSPSELRTNIELDVKLKRPIEISNSSLKDIEFGALEDELTAYMNDLRSREF
ncbi:pyrokinin-1 receptor-like [Cylas formicarius]|uniref:pyrokinin-1 receptor-like n=1 Tax=Cylas formicarius TaxID=197179 RepID=UPI002958D15C|nr:pyrokinin-1 receptor-like [Cylas formicarius]